MKILVCTLAINDWYRDIVKYSIRNFEYYCNMHDYEFIIQTENSLDTVFDNTRSPCWYKIKLIQKILKEKECDYLVWIDADCQILKHNVKLEYFIQKYIYNDYIFALTQDNNTVLNTGVMFIKNNKFNIDLMDKIWNNATDYFEDFHEQSSLAELYQSDENIKKHINIIPYGTKDELVVYWSCYYPEQNFLLHSARCVHDKLGFFFMMDTYYPFKLDEENDDEYNERMNWLNNKDICRKDLDSWLKGEFVPIKFSARCKKIFNL